MSEEKLKEAISDFACDTFDSMLASSKYISECCDLFLQDKISFEEVVSRLLTELSCLQKDLMQISCYQLLDTLVFHLKLIDIK